MKEVPQKMAQRRTKANGNGHTEASPGDQPMATVKLPRNETRQPASQVANVIPTPVMTVDRDFTVTYINPAGARAAGMTTEQCRGKKCHELFKTRHCQTAECRVAQAMQRDSVFTGTTVIDPDGRQLSIRYSGAPIKDDVGDIVGAIHYSIDTSAELTTIEQIVGAMGRASEGDFKARADETKCDGSLLEVAKGVNTMLERIAQTTQVIGIYLDRIAAGDLHSRVTVRDDATNIFKGDFALFKDKLNLCMDNLSAMADDASMVAKSAKEGDLAVRADLAKHSGAYGQIIQGLNDTLDAVAAPLAQLVSTINSVATGDLTKRIQGDYCGDFDNLKSSTNAMIDNLTQLIAGVKSKAENLAASSSQLSQAAGQSGSAVQQISESSAQMAKAAQDQSASLQQVATAMGTMSDTVNQVGKASEQQSRMVEQASAVVNQVSSAVTQITGNAQTAADGAAKSSQLTRQGDEMTRKTSDAVSGIKNSIAVMSTTVNEMNERATQLGKIVATIHDIAAQTNLLALNAAIEAARAGEHGRGFAVVADEVRKLAERTAVATKETADLIGDMQKSVKRAVDAVDEGNRRAAEGTRLSAETTQSLKSVLDEVDAVAAQMQQISAAAEQMNASTSEMVKTVDSISAAAEQNAAAAQEMIAATSEISQSVESAAGIAEENGAATEQVSASSQEMNAQIEETIALAQSLSEMAGDLREAVGKFTI
ncbi:MAG: methyl-accepting chemotaxis protein [Chloroflexi bacterium]|nr:methyl-accepting chemotaxis protein [Chloroflexota bacterium]